ncbi:uncharacterized protein LOC113373146 [Ctenocephalides felis]|uniref:uncharacterized protein LOC113373145 n=1 Tax=Ctenocephalides felis TaxID=7515 RepID=UPI000E6E5533|nr:uncharacterized protein LOC113373145 [Ctenocephalides felis]XP_026469244.1 uncharacterized protein LOC113373146 [Ctenocephalides felis]
MAGLELALDLSRSTFSFDALGRNAYKQSSLSSRILSCHDIHGLQYVPGEFGGYQTVLKKDLHPISSLAMLAYSSSESERSHSTSSETSGFNSMRSFSPIESISMKLKFNEAKLEPVMFESRNILDLNGNVRGDNIPFYTPAKTNQNYFSYNKCTTKRSECPDCGFETLD